MTDRPTRAGPSALALVAVGGALGAAARYGVAQAIRTQPGTFPWATLLTNVSGSFAIGLVLVLTSKAGRTEPLQRFLATGFLGGYTTYSTFAVETDVLFKDGHAGWALAYVVASLALGILAVGLGVVAGRQLAGTAGS